MCLKGAKSWSRSLLPHVCHDHHLTSSCNMWVTWAHEWELLCEDVKMWGNIYASYREAPFNQFALVKCHLKVHIFLNNYVQNRVVIHSDKHRICWSFQGSVSHSISLGLTNPHNKYFWALNVVCVDYCYLLGTFSVINMTPCGPGVFMWTKNMKQNVPSDVIWVLAMTKV